MTIASTTAPQVPSPAECEELATILNIKHGPVLQDRFFTLICRLEEHKLFVTMSLSSRDESFVYPVEARCVVEPKSAGTSAFAIIDFLDLYFEEFLEDESTTLPIDWADYQFEGVSFQVRGQSRNEKLEKLADELLDQSEESKQ